jgi:hypothetical protein
MNDYTPHEKRQQQHFPSRKRYGVPALAIAAAVGFFLCYLLETTFQTTPLVRSSLSLPVSTQVLKVVSSEVALVRPDNVKVIGLMFYGRAQFVNVLEVCETSWCRRSFADETSVICVGTFERMVDGEMSRPRSRS